MVEASGRFVGLNTGGFEISPSDWPELEGGGASIDVLSVLFNEVGNELLVVVGVALVDMLPRPSQDIVYLMGVGSVRALSLPEGPDLGPLKGFEGAATNSFDPFESGFGVGVGLNSVGLGISDLLHVGVITMDVPIMVSFGGDTKLEDRGRM